MDGLTGRITFDRGRRMDFALDILQLQSSGLIKVRPSYQCSVCVIQNRCSNYMEVK